MSALPTPTVPVSWGELLDKMTILAIKQRRIADPVARENVTRERDALWQIGATALENESVRALFAELTTVNAALWDIEDAIRREEAQQRFGPRFIGLARSVYQQNDRRAALKRDINQLLGSELIEEKSYWSAGQPILEQRLEVEPAV